MQGKKNYTPQLFYELSLDRLVPQDNFYRQIDQHLDLRFLYKATKSYYGTEGQQSIDPVELRSHPSSLKHLVLIPRMLSRYYWLVISTTSTAIGLCFVIARTV